MIECLTCRNFFKFTAEEEETKNGFCRKNAPNATAQSIGGYGFPRVNEHDWCGDYSDNIEAGHKVFRGLVD